MGEVWRAKHPTLDRSVAVKLIRAEVQDRPLVREAFIREVRNLSQLHAGQTLQVLDFGFSERDEPFMVTEFLEGWDLGKRLKANGALPIDEAVFIAVEVLKSLSEAHARGIIHRDLKPANVFLQQLPSVDETRFAIKVLDFGIAKVLQPEDPDMTLWPGMALKGSPRYMSPEQILSSQITPAADIYALGGLLYVMLTGEPPFKGGREVVLEAHLKQTPRPPTEIREEIPLQLEQLIMRCLAKKPEERPSSAGTLIKQLSGLLHTLQLASDAVDFDDEAGEGEEPATLQHEPHWDRDLFESPTEASAIGVSDLSFSDLQRGAGARAKLKATDLFGEPQDLPSVNAADLFGDPHSSPGVDASDLFPAPPKPGVDASELFGTPPRSPSEGGGGFFGPPLGGAEPPRKPTEEALPAFGSMSGLLSEEEQRKMRPRGDAPKLDPNALFLGPEDASAPLLATTQDQPRFPLSAKPSVVGALVEEMREAGEIMTLPPPEASQPGGGLHKTDSSMGFNIGHLGLSTPPAESSPPAKPPVDSGVEALGFEAPSASSEALVGPPDDSIAGMSVDQAAEALQKDADTLQLQFEGRPSKPPRAEVGKRQREAEARLGLPSSPNDVPRGIDDPDGAPASTPAYVRTLERRPKPGKSNEIWIALGVIAALLVLWIVREPIARQLGVRPQSELGRFLGMVVVVEEDRAPKESAAELKARLLKQRLPSMEAINAMEEAQRQREIGQRSKDVRVTVIPDATFTRLDTKEVLCQVVDECVVPIDVDVKVEAKGHRSLTLDGDDLYDRRGGSWDIRLPR